MNRRLYALPALLVSIALSGPPCAIAQPAAPKPNPEAQRARAQIEQQNTQYVKAFGDADVNEVVALYDTAATELLEKGRVVRGRAELLRYWGDWIKQYGPIKLTLDSDEFWFLGDRAYETGKYTTVYKTKEGKEATVGGNYATLWKREGDGYWKILAVFDTPK